MSSQRRAEALRGAVQRGATEPQIQPIAASAVEGSGKGGRWRVGKASQEARAAMQARKGKDRSYRSGGACV